MSGFRDLSLQRKLLRLVGVAVIVAVLVAAISVVIYDSYTYRPRALREGESRAQSLAETVAGAVESGDAAAADKYLRAFRHDPEIRELAILRDGEILARYLRPGAQPARRGPAAATAPTTLDSAIAVTQPIVSRGQPIGSVWLVADLRPFSQRWLEYAALFGVAALSLLVFTAMLSVMIRRTVSEPVRALVAAARRVSELKDFRLRVATPTQDEIGQLAHEFNAMLAAVEERDHALRVSGDTARRQVEEIESLYANAEIGLCMLDRDFRYLRINKCLADINGRPVEQTLGRTVREVVPDLADTLEPIYRRILATGEPVVNVEIQGYVPTSTDLRYWVVSNYPVRSAGGDICGINIVVIETTQRKRAEQERANLEAQLRQSQKMQALGTLAGGIAHDFNNVLTAISGNARLALDDLPADHPAAVSLLEIARGTDRAKDLVRRILAFSRQEQTDRHLIDLRPVVDEALRLLRATVPTMIDIRAEAAPNLPKVLADATQVHQVLMNLGTNACDAMQDRGGTLTVKLANVNTDSRLQKLSPDLNPGRYLRISVEDTGSGIDAATLERVFEPFFTTKPPGRGTGLGLSVVHGIMRGHQGAVLAHSEPGRGSVFDLYFPVPASALETAPAAVADSVPPGQGEHILYVDDEEPLVFLVTRMMERMGYRVTGLTRASDAIEAVRADPQRFDMVISDLGMPGMSGMELAAALLAIRPDLPIIITSGYVRPEDAKRAKEVGVSDIVLKPGTVAEMSQLIRRRLMELRGKT